MLELQLAASTGFDPVAVAAMPQAAVVGIVVGLRQVALVAVVVVAADFAAHKPPARHTATYTRAAAGRRLHALEASAGNDVGLLGSSQPLPAPSCCLHA